MRKTVLFLLVLLLTAGTVLLRYVKTEKQTNVPLETQGDGPFVLQNTPTQGDGPFVLQNTPAASPAFPSEEGGPAGPEELPPQGLSPASLLEGGGPAAPEGVPSQGTSYTDRSYQLVTDLVYVCREEGPEAGREKIDALLAELEGEDPALARLWRGITDELALVCSDGWIDGTLPAGLRQDDSLCFVVLGFQLLYDGDMAPELLGRCETALKALQQYPNSFVALTGGGTAFGNRKATEADVMADWFIQQGIAPERIIIENQSMTTDQNAVNTCAILTARYPQVRQVVVITSDYHMPLGCMLFDEAALLHAWQTGGDPPYTVAPGPSWATSGSAEYTGHRNIMTYVWIMAQRANK